jgi:hypothetical protein
LKKYGKMESAQFLRNLIKFCPYPYKIDKILTDNGIQFINRSVDKHTFIHIFDENKIEHRLTKAKHL